ncbi:diguanylate cyclase [Paludibacterium sp. dN 18-1]|uniref:diguanylate cyclase n=1 Tax=Paludibacterium denitrificans TaxID=2675226 RepID=A0A844GHQ7_9NEIS|nr:GGDEF domain-containing protein [Paludibacterium denitrificans]MTD34194.1 diguanylate cyclase [Paludibacterium denitrificans]
MAQLADRPSFLAGIVLGVRRNFLPCGGARFLGLRHDHLGGVGCRFRRPSIVNTAPSFRTSFGFTFCVLIIPICYYFWLGDPIYIKLATGSTILLLVILQFGWDAYQQFVDGAKQLVLNRRISLQLEMRNNELDELNRQLSVTATHDSLTDLYNRHFIVAQLKQQLDLFRRHGNPCSIVLMDIDRFKQVNDQFGHASGDEVLVVFSFMDGVANTIRRYFRTLWRRRILADLADDRIALCTESCRTHTWLFGKYASARASSTFDDYSLIRRCTNKGQRINRFLAYPSR